MPLSPKKLFSLSPASREPLYRQIYNRFRGAIAEGVLKPGDRVLSARALAKELGVARGTIETAYSLLGAEGYIQSRGQAGTVVTPGLQAPAAAPLVSPSRLEASSLDLHVSSVRPFQMGLPALDALPRKTWVRLSARCLRAAQPDDFAYPPAHGIDALRNAIASYLRVARGIQCSPAQVFITSGYRSIVQLVIRALLKPGEQVWVEDPGYPPTRALLSQEGVIPVPVPVDGEGMVVSHGIAHAGQARAAVVTPAHQSPLCMSLSLLRRQALLEWATGNKSWIIEDDYDGEYRYVSRPLPALKSLDGEGRVLYAGTFSKVLFPGVRVAYLVVPEAQVDRFELVSQVCADGVPAVTQATISAFMMEGHFARHIQRMRRLYSERRDAAARGLAQIFGSRMHIEPQPGGMHLVVRIRGDQTDRQLAGLMVEQGMYAQPLSRWSFGGASEAGLLLGFTNIRSQAHAETLGLRIVDLMKDK